LQGGKVMKIAISSTGRDLDAQVDPRFGRCQYFVLVDPETMEFEMIDNPGMGAMGGAGVQAAQSVARKGVSALITGNLGPNAASALSAAGIRVCLVTGGTVRQVAQDFKAGNLKEASGPTVPSHFGMGGKRGPGGRQGMGGGPHRGQGSG
jgi:predicted Fe-Mo cluster-binding NifX family protein